MIIKSHSIRYGYKELQGRLEKHSGQAMLVVDEIGMVTPLEFIKQGLSIKLASPQEMAMLKQAGYNVKIREL
ncbi:MAG TPA: hypothetical protein DEA96_18985 [Leptospiraceae bacterium]|jgi:hypothetical protein|nr:hypothetical protein [Spirochaetaceae bacterium]HBS07065.1 hypothetical protein [Leptospiraceae bacterium]|tara:strand:+ start:129297 stop:129512 length:216 start_codon:yes stop_codon:yes gene_type:complete